LDDVIQVGGFKSRKLYYIFCWTVHGSPNRLPIWTPPGFILHLNSVRTVI